MGKKEIIPCQKADKKSGKKTITNKIKLKVLKLFDIVSNRMQKKIIPEKIEKNILLIIFINYP
jgi:hypothetical protein